MKSTTLPKISVILPVYNGEKFLEESINSILDQTFNHFEFIIINDCSKDNTLKIIQKYQKKDKRILLINNDKNLGSAESINKGLKRAKGKYIACFCADDLSHKKRLEIEFNYLEKNRHIFLVGTSAVYIDENGKEIRRFRKYDNYKILSWRLRKSCGIIFPSIMFRNEGVVSFKKEFVPTDDYNLYFELLKIGKNITNIPHFLVKVRVHNKSSSILNKKEQEENMLRVINNFKELKDNIHYLKKVKYSIFLVYHYLKTRKEKRIKK